ncbi:hypothetical protein J6590_073160 [Homalodisca vitripennis]|nr:hypothetical protein J6590_073160 [Homalodisca vitripennis]
MPQTAMDRSLKSAVRWSSGDGDTAVWSILLLSYHRDRPSISVQSISGESSVPERSLFAQLVLVVFVQHGLLAVSFKSSNVGRVYSLDGSATPTYRSLKRVKNVTNAHALKKRGRC